MNEKDKAKQLLEHKKYGYSFSSGMKSLRKRHTFYLIAIFACLYLKPKYDYDVFFLILIGFFIGTIVRDTDWLRTFKSSWPFTEKITDWDKVETIAKDEGEK